MHADWISGPIHQQTEQPILQLPTICIEVTTKRRPTDFENAEVSIGELAKGAGIYMEFREPHIGTNLSTVYFSVFYRE